MPQDPALRISDDRLWAVLDLPAQRALSTDDLKQLLQAKGVCSGLQREALQEAMQAKPEARHLVVACGRPVEMAQPGRLEPPLDLASLPRRITAGTPLGRFVPERLTAPGLGVDGLPILPPEVAVVPIGLRPGRGIDVVGDRIAISNRDGLLIRDRDGTLRVAVEGLVERELTSIAVRVEARAAQAWISLRPGEYVAPVTLMAALENAQVAYSTDPLALAEAGRIAREPRHLIVARGPSSENPLNAGMGPTHDAPAADAGTRSHPAEAPPLAPLRKDVFHRETNGRATAPEQLVVPGDLDPTHGRIDTHLPVVVHGNIKQGVTVRSAGDITVHGSIEDATVIARGNILVKGGILAGTERVKARGNLTARHCTNRVIKARDVVILGCAQDSTILATGTVMAKSLVGGAVVAAMDVCCETLGGPEGLSTRVEAGSDPRRRRLEQDAEVRLHELERQTTELRPRCQELARQLDAHALDSQAGALAHELRRLVGEYQSAERLLAEMRELVRQKTERSGPVPPPATAVVEVRDTTFPGVTLVFGMLTRVINEPLHASRFQVKDGGIVG